MIIVANWKSYKTPRQVDDWLDKFAQNSLVLRSEAEVIIAPSDVCLARTVQWSKDSMFSKVLISAQDVSNYPMGAYTGAVSAQVMKEIGVEYALIGHRERREYFSESLLMIAQKAIRCVEQDIVPIVCVDEEDFQEQAKVLSPEVLEHMILAFEPPSAIGSGKPADPSFVREYAEKTKIVYGENIKFLYGGSVSNITIQDYLDFCDGFLIGSASLDPDQFSSLILSL